MAELVTRTYEGIEIPAPGVWNIDPSHSVISAVARHLMVAKVRGYFRTFSGKIHVAEDPLDSWVEVEIDAASIDTGTPERDAHLRSPDFLDAERHPKLTFKSTKLEPLGGNRFRLEGDLTIRGLTRRVALDATFEGVGSSPWGDQRAAFSATTELNREDWGITWNQVLETGGFLVSKTLKVEIEIEAVKAA